MFQMLLEFKLKTLIDKDPSYICYRPGQKSFIFFVRDSSSLILPKRFYTTQDNVQIIKDLDKSIQVSFLVWTPFEKEGNKIGIAPAVKVNKTTGDALANGAPITMEKIFYENVQYEKKESGYTKRSQIHTENHIISMNEDFNVKCISSRIEKCEVVGDDTYVTYKCLFQKNNDEYFETRGTGAFRSNEYEKIKMFGSMKYFRRIFSRIPLLGSMV